MIHPKLQVNSIKSLHISILTVSQPPRIIHRLMVYWAQPQTKFLVQCKFRALVRTAHGGLPQLYALFIVLGIAKEDWWPLQAWDSYLIETAVIHR